MHYVRAVVLVAVAHIGGAALPVTALAVADPRGLARGECIEDMALPDFGFESPYG